MPPSFTMESRGATFRPASTDNARVTVNRAAGSKFIFKSRAGEAVVDFGAEVKLAIELMLPRTIPNAFTVDVTLVIANGALKGLAIETTTWLMLFWLVVGNTVY